MTYMETILQAVEKGNLVAKDGILMPQIAHDNWCKIYKNKPCNCNPEISVETDDGLVYLNKDGSINRKI
jgi:hypothetical protein